MPRFKYTTDKKNGGSSLEEFSKRYIMDLLPRGNVTLDEIKIPVKKQIKREESKFTELDVICKDISQILDALSADFIVCDIRQVSESPLRGEATEDEIYSALVDSEFLSAQERYWEMHTRLEPIWGKTSGDIRAFLQGLILVASSQVKIQMRNETAAISLHKRGLSMIESSSMKDLLKVKLPSELTYPIRFTFILKRSILAERTRARLSKFVNSLNQ